MDGWKVKWSARPNFPKGRMAEKITRQRDGRVESYMVGTKRNSPKDGELNGWHENSSPKEWTTQKSLAKGMDGWKVKWLARK